MKTLNRKRDFGTVAGDTEGRAFSQDGVYFDANGNEWGVPIFQPEPESIGEEAARVAEEQRLQAEREAAEKQAADEKAAADKAAADQAAADKAAADAAGGKGNGSKKPAAAPADDQVSKQLAT